MSFFERLAAALAALADLPSRAWRKLRPAPTNAAPGKQPGRSTPSRRTIGPYRIERELGRGAMGTVYLGRHRHTGRQVALKTMKLRRADGEAADAVRARFLAEAGAAAGLQHPNIVGVFEAGVSGDLGFIAMEPVPGEDLTAHARPGRLLPLPTVLQIGVQCARALAHAHRRGVVHRDIKPANLLWSGTEGGAVKLTDFGIARIQEAGAWRTRTGQVLGSPAYMSPEQMAGGSVDGRSDLYALGVVLFELLTGGLPHRAESMGGLMRAIAQQPAADLRSLRPDLPEPLARIVARALHKPPELRHADGDRMADELALVLAAINSGASPEKPATPPRP